MSWIATPTAPNGTLGVVAMAVTHRTFVFAEALSVGGALNAADTRTVLESVPQVAAVVELVTIALTESPG
jgi:hypothetical protein